MAPPRRRRSNNHRHGKKSKASITTKLPLLTSRICELPDDILVSILTRLPLKQAVLTSILSKRWRHVWKYIPTLNLDGSDALYNLARDHRATNKQIKMELPGYISWVDQIVSSHKAPTLDEFKVRFDIRSDLHGKTKPTIDSWIRFAVEKRVKRLTINLSTYYGTCGYKLGYTFPKLSLFYNSLTHLELNSVHISGEVLESFLCICLTLEYLSVSYSDTLEGLRVAAPSLGLKYLKIRSCKNIKKLEISALNLVSFDYSGRPVHVQYQNLTKLVDVFLGAGGYNYDLQKCFSDLGCHLSQIEVLKLDHPCVFKSNWIPATEYPVFKRLKKLDVLVSIADQKYDILYISSLIKAFPFLHRLKLQILTCESKPIKRRMRKREPCPHYNMKIVEIVGFVGFAIDLELVRYLIKSVVSLDTIILDTRNALSINNPWGRESNKVHTRRRAREQAELLVRPVLKPGTDLVII